MSNWFERLGTGGLTVVKWPYPVRYNVENQISTDVLVLGGGPAGCLAAISAARTGARVVLVEKGHPRSSGGTGVDHWLNSPNPCSKITPEECVEWESKSYGGYMNSLSRYIAAREGYDTLLELEGLGRRSGIRKGNSRALPSGTRRPDFCSPTITKTSSSFEFRGPLLNRRWLKSAGDCGFR